MRVVVVSPDWPETTGGGIAALARTLCLGLAELGHSVEAWVRGGGPRDAPLRRAAPDLPFTLRPLPGRSWRAGGPRRWAETLAAPLRAAPPDLLVAMNWEPAAGILELGWSGPWGAFAHGRDVTANLAPEARTQRRDQTVRATPQWWVLTRWLRLELEARGVPGARVREVPAAVPGPMVAPPWERPRHGRPLVLSVGRLVARKGHGRLVAAWPYIDSRADLVIVGDGPERPALQAQVRALGLADRVRVAGAVAESEVERLRREAALFALPARQGSDGDTEGYGLVYLEAAAWGLPSLGCRTAGAAEAILDGRTGIQLPEDADPATIAAAIDGALASEERRLVLARGAWNRWDRGHRPRHLAHAIVDGARPWGPRE